MKTNLYIAGIAFALIFSSCTKEELNVESSELESTVASEKTPSTLLGLSSWKLTVPEDDDGDGEADEVYVDYTDNTDASDGSLLNLHKKGKDYYYKGGRNWVNFRADAGDPSTSGSNNPRCELRQMTSTGETEKWWDLNSSIRRSMECTFKVLQTPSSKKVCFMQIHGDEDHDGWDDVIRIQLRSANENAGIGDTATVYVMGDVVDNSADDLFEYTLGDTLRFTIAVHEGKVYVYDYLYDVRTSTNPEDGNPIRIYNSDSERNYFKAGTYLQSEPSSGYGETTFNRIKLRVKS